VKKNSIKKIDIIKNLNISQGFTSNYSKKVINDLIAIIINNIRSGNFNLKNIGTFKIINKKQRQGRNPKTKEKFIISARKSVVFTPSKKMSECVKRFNE
tara:strand:+ start:526 stop:822 length:297 start_codon:yes stop_codon:yes gene_type:complete